MLLQVRKKDILNSSEKVLKVGYCQLQSLLNYENRFGYSSSNVNGWSCDYYKIDNVIISTGYNPIGDTVKYEVVKRYELQAEKITNDYKLSYEERKQKVTELLHDFMNEAIE